MRFGRKARDEQPEEAHGPETAEDVAEATGPFDEADVDLEGREFVDLGSLLVTPAGPMEMRLQVDEESGQVMAALLVDQQGALELRAFAAARSGSAWDELRPQIAEETRRLGGSASEQEGPFGTELACEVPVQTPDGAQALQQSRVIGHQGPRWLLRATLLGAPATDPAAAGPWEETIRQVVVRRGRDAMAPGAQLPLRLPPEARRAE